MNPHLSIAEAPLSLNHGDDLEPAKVNLQILVGVLGDLRLWTPCPALDLIPDSVAERRVSGRGECWENMGNIMEAYEGMFSQR